MGLGELYKFYIMKLSMEAMNKKLSAVAAIWHHGEKLKINSILRRTE